MSDSPTIDRARLGQFIGLLVLAGVGLSVSARVLSVSPVSLAPVYMFTPLAAALIVCRLGDLSFSTVGLRIGRPRWLVLSALGGLPLVGLMLVMATAVPGVG